jgi:amino acid transporter
MATPTETVPSPTVAPRRQLTLFDSTSIIMGIIIGATIYESSPLIAINVRGLGGLVLAWLLGGVCSLLGALCYAELATTYPEAGGDYVYLTRAFGRSIGFWFAWTQLWVIRPGSIGAFAYVFAHYAQKLQPLPLGDAPSMLLYAAGSVILLSLINILGVPEGKWTQNLLTVAKVLGLAGIVIVGLTLKSPGASRPVIEPAWAGWHDVVAQFGVAMIFVLYAYGGWNEMAYVAAEVRDPRRNISRALILGTVGVTAIYLLVTLAFVHALGLAGLRSSDAVAADVLRLGLGRRGGQLVSLLICISALGGTNGMIFTGARIYYAMGRDHRLYAWLGRWSPRFGTPVISLLIQAAITLGLIVGFGLTASGFNRMVKFTSPPFWAFLVLVGLSVFVLRWREGKRGQPPFAGTARRVLRTNGDCPLFPDAGTTRSYRVPGYPVTPLLFCLYSGYMVYTSLAYAYRERTWEAVWSVEILLMGAVLSIFSVYPLGKVGKIVSGLALSAAGAAAAVFHAHLARLVLVPLGVRADARNEILLAAIPLLALGLVVLAAGLLKEKVTAVH